MSNLIWSGVYMYVQLKFSNGLGFWLGKKSHISFTKSNLPVCTVNVLLNFQML